jgi:uncharacterized RDD family membrane protein YckC
MRVLAYAIDYIPLRVLIYIIWASLGVEMSLENARRHPNGPAAVIAGFVLVWLYHAICESSPMQGSFGKKLLGISVTDLEGERIGFGRATGRHIGKAFSWLTSGVGFMMAGFTREKQALHDRLAGCRVCRFVRRPVED